MILIRKAGCDFLPVFKSTVSQETRQRAKVARRAKPQSFRSSTGLIDDQHLQFVPIRRAVCLCMLTPPPLVTSPADRSVPQKQVIVLLKMRSQLTRTVFRRLLSNKPLLFRSCARQHAAPQLHSFRPRLSRQNAVQTRTLFGFSAKAQPKPKKEPNLDPGLDGMMEVRRMQAIKARPPPPADLIVAWKLYFQYKTTKKQAVVNYHAVYVLSCLQYILRTTAKEEGNTASRKQDTILATSDLRMAAEVLTLMPNDKRDALNELGREIYAELNCRADAEGTPRSLQDFRRYISVLADSGAALEAKGLLLDRFAETAVESAGQRAGKVVRTSWLKVIEGLASENNEQELVQTVENLESIGLQYTPSIQRVITTFYADKDNVEKTKQWFTKPISSSDYASPETYSAILRFSIRNKELEWCKSLLPKLLEGHPPKEIWDTIFQWSAGALGKGVEDVERMMNVMIRHSDHDTSERPDITTINGLVALAMFSNDPYLAERYVTLGIKHGIYPNAQTFIHQLNYRVGACDLSGAHAAYTALQSEEVLAGEDLPAINKYLRALCIASSPNYDLIMEICTDLEERKANLEAPTASALGMVYLARGEITDLINMLQTESYHYTKDERASIRDKFLAYTLDPATPTASSWESYQVFRQLFDETNLDVRTQAMNEFFRRGRSDMGLHAFGHMRAHISPDRRPVLDTYIQCFEGIASCADREALDTVHNMMKLDSSIDPDTRLYNSLMMAYTECGDSDKAVDFWDDITNSIEGPSYRSLELVFRACQRNPFGDIKAKEIWSKLKRMEIEITQDVYRAYVGALAGRGRLEDAKALVESSEKDLGYKPDVQTYVLYDHLLSSFANLK